MPRDVQQLVDNRYRVSGPLGSGGMAEVYLAHDDVLDRKVALKVMSRRYADDEEFVERFKREAQSAAALSHPNIVSIFDRGEDESGTYYIAMEYLPGGTLKDRILRRGALPARTAAAVTLQIAEALSAAHRAGVVHRDIKPHNVLITASGDVKVGDFGIARAASSTTMTRTGSILGTAHYISPEQAMGEPVGPQSDLYSLGIVLYEMLTGELPFDAETPIGIAMKHVNGPLRPPRTLNPDVPEGINAITCRLLAKNPAERYADADELIEDLERVMGGLAPSQGTTKILNRAAPPHGAARRGSTAQMDTLPPPLPDTESGRRRRRHRRWIPVLFLFLLLALIGGLASAVVGRGPAQAEVPNLEDARSIDAAREIVARAPGEFTVVEGARVDSEEPVGEVVSQSPGPGGKADARSEITLEISGRQLADLPDVRGKPEEEATRILDEAGFEVEARPQESGPQDEGRVIDQDPAGGVDETAEEGSRVKIAVGSGPATVEVPELAGNTPEQAMTILEEADLRLGGQTEMPSNDVAEGQIIEQQPAAGTDLRPGTPVNVTVSSGPNLVSVPNVVGQTVEQAQTTLYNALFLSTAVTVQSNQPAGTVVSTNPPAGTPADPYAITVTLNVSEGPPPASQQPTPQQPTQQPTPQQPTPNNGGGGNNNNGNNNNNNSNNDGADNGRGGGRGGRN